MTLAELESRLAIVDRWIRHGERVTAYTIRERVWLVTEIASHRPLVADELSILRAACELPSPYGMPIESHAWSTHVQNKMAKLEALIQDELARGGHVLAWSVPEQTTPADHCEAVISESQGKVS